MAREGVCALLIGSILVLYSIDTMLSPKNIRYIYNSANALNANIIPKLSLNATLSCTALLRSTLLT